MKIVGITDARKDLYNIVDGIIRYNDTTCIHTQKGDAVVMSMEDYEGILATLEIMRTPGLPEKILRGRDEPLEEGILWEDVEWDGE